MPHSAGTFTIGLVTSDFMTLNDAFGDYSGGVGGLTGDLTYVVEGNTTLDTTLATRAIYFQKMNGFTFKITASVYHGGVWGNGKRITITGVSDMQIRIGILSLLGQVIVENLEFSGRRLDVRGEDPLGQVATGKHIVKNCLLNGTVVLMYQRNRTNSDNNFFNNKVFNGAQLNVQQGSFSAVQPTIVENNTFYISPAIGVVLILSSTNPLLCDSQVVLRSNGFFGNAANDVSVTATRTMPFAYNNAFSATGATSVTWREGSSGNVNNVLATEFESLVETSPDFLRLNKGRLSAAPVVDPDRGSKPLRCKFRSDAQYNYGGFILPTGGLAPTLSVNDLAGEPYGKWGDYPIGCYVAELV